MIPNYFVQTEENTGYIESNIIKRLLYSSYILKTLSLIFIILAVALLNYLYLIGFFVLFIIGVILRQSVLERIGKFEYILYNDTLEIRKISNFGKEKGKISINLSNVKSISDEVKLRNNDDFSAIKEGQNIINIIYLDNDIEKNLYFTPSLYLESILRKKLYDIFRQCGNN